MSRSPIIRFALAAARNFEPSSATSRVANNPCSRQNTTNARRPHDSRPVIPPEVRNRLEVRSQPSQQPHELNITPALAFQLAAGTHLVEVSIDLELKEIARVITRSTRSRRDRTHETQADHVKTFGEGINHPDCCFSPDVVVYPCRQEACLLTVLASNIAHGKGRIVVDAAFSI